MDEVDALLMAMDPDAPAANAALAKPLPCRADQVAARRQRCCEEGPASELWNPTIAWEAKEGGAIGAGSAAAPAAPEVSKRAMMELARQKAVRSLAARFRQCCEQLNTGWSEATVTQQFERWVLASKAADECAGLTAADPVLPLPSGVARDEPGLKRELFGSARLQQRAVKRFMADMQKALAKAHRTINQPGAARAGKRVVVSVATQLVRDDDRMLERTQPMLGGDGQPVRASRNCCVLLALWCTNSPGQSCRRWRRCSSSVTVRLTLCASISVTGTSFSACCG